MGEKRGQVRIVRIAEAGPSETETSGRLAVRQACAADGGGVDLIPPGQEAQVEGVDATLSWLVWDGDSAVGAAWLRMPSGDRRDGTGRFQVEVLPERRGSGHGIDSALLALVREAAAAEGYRRLLTGVRSGRTAGTDPAAGTDPGTDPGVDTEADADSGTPDEQYLVDAGFTVVAEKRRLLLRVTDCDLEALRTTVKAASEGYTLARWQGVAPADLIGAFAASRAATEEGSDNRPADEGRAPWDEERVRALARDAAGRGRTLLTVAALGSDEQGEVVAGFSEIVLPGGGATRARQSDTAVLEGHRGRGLGLWVKAAMLEWLLGAHPEVTEVSTECRPTDGHMIGINERLGFRQAGSARYYASAWGDPR